MSNAPHFSINLTSFVKDPYPYLKQMQLIAPISYVPELDATLLTLRNDIFVNEKKTHIFSSLQPDGLMSQLMGENMMRKDGHAHLIERKAIFPTVSPKTVRDVWKSQFEENTKAIIHNIKKNKKAELMTEIAMPASAHMLKVMTGLTNMADEEMDRTSQGMIDGCSNYIGDPQITANCNNCTDSIDQHITDKLKNRLNDEDLSLLAVQIKAGLSMPKVRANIKLAISGGQNEPRDAISGAIATILKHPKQLKLVREKKCSWMQVFEEYARWMSPIGMSPRRIAKEYSYSNINFEVNDRVFLMFGAANRDPNIFSHPEKFNITRNCKDSIAFGAGPHFCAGAWASKALITEVVLPLIFDMLPNLRLNPVYPIEYTGWAFRGPLAVNVIWD
jgi:cytochrome P450